MILPHNIELKAEGKQWEKENNLFIAGYAFWESKRISTQLLSTKIAQCTGISDFNDLVNKLNGCFALIYVVNESVIWAAVDKIRSIPLFINRLKNSISDQPEWKEFDFSEAKTKLDHFEYCLGNQTFNPNIVALLPGESVEIQNNTFYISQNFKHSRNEESMSYELSSQKFKQIIPGMFDRFIEYANQRTIAIPLSGGYDSRFILAGLYAAGYRKLVAFTYGNESEAEATIAKQVCKQLGVAWHFIPYTPDLLNEILSDDWFNYALHASKTVSLPQEQEYFALRFMIEKNILPRDCIIAPGFCGDVQAGSFLPDKFFYRFNDVTTISTLAKFIAIKQDKYKLTNISRYLIDSVRLKKSANRAEFISNMEEFVFNEREAKYIINGVRCYEHFGFDWYLPLWDSEFVKLWQQIPSAYRYDKALYKDVLRNELFVPQVIDFETKNFDSHLKSGNIGTLLRYLIPQTVKALLKRILVRNQPTEINNLDYLCRAVEEKYNLKPDTFRTVNESITFLFFEQLRRKIKN